MRLWNNDGVVRQGAHHARTVVLLLLLGACGDGVPPPPGTREPVEPASAAPVAAPEPVVAVPQTECEEPADCRLGTNACRNTFVAVRAGVEDHRPPYLPAHSCARRDRQIPVAPTCVEGRCALTELSAPELRTCDVDADCILVPFACHTTPIRAEARDRFEAMVDGAHCARWIPEGTGVCRLGVCVDPAWLAE